MNSFIGKLVDALVAEHGQSLDSLCVVFPSRRACVFFKEALRRKIAQATWAPAVYAIEDFVREIHPVTILDNVSLTFELYPIYKDVFPHEPFDKFYSWGSMLISDFDEIDQYLVDAQSVFRNLFELKEIDTTIESWLNEDGEATEFQLRYLRFWELMGNFYAALRKKLDLQGMSAPGMAIRELAERLSKEKPRLPWGQVVFAGFNALSPAEEKLIKALVDWELGSCYWDLDAYYVDDIYQEAGRFFREMRLRWEKDGKQQTWNWIGEDLAAGEKHITLTGVPLRVAQAKVTGLKLKSLLEDGVVPESTAVVLPDENLLFPLLHSLPAELKDVNVTMGFPLRNTPLYSLVDAIIQLHENADRLRPGRSRGTVYYFRDVQNILRHPYVNAIIFKDARDLLFQINKEKSVYLSPKDFDTYPEDHLLRFLFQPWTDIPQVIHYYLELYRRLKLSLEGEGKDRRKIPAVESEYLFHFYTLTQKLRDKLENYQLNFDLKIFRRLYKEVIQGGSIPFSGEPLRGLQVMGMLETRVLDFENVIVLSVNEGILPVKPASASFIPYNLRKVFGLPTHEDKDAIYAYHFYRLLQRARNITLIYNTEQDTFGSGEKSRFVAQIEAELAQRNPGIQLVEETLTFGAKLEDTVPIEVPKTADLLQQLKEFATEKGFSPSALSTYLNCPLQFYYRYLLRLKEQDEPEESMEENTFGLVLHGTLERLYEDYVGKMVQPAAFELMQQQVEAVVEEQFKEVTHTENTQSGKNHLLLGVIRKLVHNLLDIDREHAPFRIEGLERELETNVITLRQPDGVKLRGYLDRIDVVNGETRIIDYKTGKVKRVTLADFEDIREGTKRREAFQLSTYAYLYLRNHPGSRAEPNTVRSGIYYMRNLSEGLQLLEVGPTKASTLDLQALEDFEAELVRLLDEIFDPEAPFIQTEEVDRCRFCPYKVMCVRT